MASQKSPANRPKVGLAVFVTSPKHPNCVLLGVRKGSHGHLKSSLPGGHLEFGESWQACGHREVLEETGLKLKDVKFSTVINAKWSEEDKMLHFVDIFMTGQIDCSYKDEPENPEPDKCLGWEWYDWDKFPQEETLFAPLRMVRDQGFNPFTHHNKVSNSTHQHPNHTTSGTCLTTNSTSPLLRPKVGLAVFVTSPKHPGCVLLGVRKGSHGAHKFSPPGGHLEFGESWEECGRREVLEETGLKLKEVEYGSVVNVVWEEGDKAYHYISLVMRAQLDSSFKEEPENPEPEKCEGWKWYNWSDFPHDDELFTPLRTIRDHYNPFDGQ